MNNENYHNRKRWVISALLALPLILLSSFIENNSGLQVTTNYSDETQEWIVSGECIYSRLKVDVCSYSMFGFQRTGKFNLRVPDAGKRQISSDQYKDDAIAQARTNIAHWQLNPFAILLVFAIQAIVIRAIWWLFQKPKQPNNVLNRTVDPAGSTSG